MFLSLQFTVKVLFTLIYLKIKKTLEFPKENTVFNQGETHLSAGQISLTIPKNKLKQNNLNAPKKSHS